MVTVTVNGKKRQLPGPTGLPSFLTANDVNPRMIAIGYNGEVVHRDKWSEIVLNEGDVVDIVHMVGGG